jgi:hypothetical protein
MIGITSLPASAQQKLARIARTADDAQALSNSALAAVERLRREMREAR